MHSLRTKLIVFGVLWAAVVVVAVIAVRYFTNPQWEIERHKSSMCALLEELNDNPDSGVRRDVETALSSHRTELIGLGYLEEVAYFVPIVEDPVRSNRLFNALREFRKSHCVSYWHFEPRPGAGVVIKVTDVPERHEEWKSIIESEGVSN